MSNPFNFIDPLLLQFPANKIMVCPIEDKTKTPETYFNSKKKEKKQNWAYDNYFFHDDTFDVRKRRDDRTNIEVHMEAICKEEKEKKVPTCTQSWYGHRTANYVEKTTGEYARVLEHKNFYRPNGMNWPKKPREELSETNSFSLS